MHLPEIDRYAHLRTYLHSWDPRAKIASFSFLILSVVLLGKLPVALVGFALACAMVVSSRIPLRFILKQLRWVLLFVSVFFVLMPFFIPGRELFGFHSLVITQEGLYKATLIAVKALSIILLIFPMIGTSPFPITIKALEGLRVPRVLVQIGAFAYRYIFLSIDEGKRMITALTSRGFERKNDLHTLKTLGTLIGMMFVRSYERTERVHQAMVSRGYDGNMVTLREFHLQWVDVGKAVFVSLLGALLISLELTL